MNLIIVIRPRITPIMVGNNLEFDCGIGMCGKAGQGAAVGIGQPTVKIDSITVGGTN